MMFIVGIISEDIIGYISLDFYAIFETTFKSNNIKVAFKSLFELLTEIHLFNYVQMYVGDPD